MKSTLQFCVALLFLISCGKSMEMESKFAPSFQPKQLNVDFYKKGENIQYTGKIGVFNAAEIEIIVDTNIRNIQNVSCNKITLRGVLSGTVDWFTNVDDKFTSYVNVENGKPHVFIRDVHENKYTLVENSIFDHTNTVVKVINKTTTRADSIKNYPTSIFIQDPITAYFQLRKIDFARYKTNDTISMDVFLETESFNLKIVYLGKEKVKSKIGKQNCIVITPLIPDNQILIGKNPIKAWITDDENRIPVKIHAKTWIGGLEVDIKSYSKK